MQHRSVCARVQAVCRDGLTDAEYFWEPVANTWSIRPRGHGRAAMAFGGGEFVIDFADPEPSPAPVTTIAWRLAHLITGVFGSRVADHFGGGAARRDAAVLPAVW